jgi:deoxyribose-phosphate aldolase
MRKHSPEFVQVKAAGGIRDLDGLLAARELGITRCGASRTADILNECRSRLGLPPITHTTAAVAGY